MAYAHPCLYCGDQTRQRTDEHVLQRGFGAELVLVDEVCAHCNTDVFSPLDGALIRMSRRLWHVDHPMNRGGPSIIHASGLTFDDEAERWYLARLDQRLNKPITFPQFWLVGRSLSFLIDSTDPSLVEGTRDSILKELRKQERITFENVVHGAQEPRLEPFFVRSAPWKYAVHAETEEACGMARHEVAQLAAVSYREDSREERVTEQPKLHYSMTFELGAYERAVAKTALNFLCHVWGPETARSSALDPLRDFALNDGENTFVIFDHDRLQERDLSRVRFDAMVGRPGFHSMLLVGGGPASLTLYLYERPFATVRLTADDTALRSGDDQVLGRFDYTRRTCRISRALDRDGDFHTAIFGPR